MKETFNKYRDTLLIVALVACAAAFGWNGGAFLFNIVKWPFAVAVVAGIGFMLGNDGAHAVKRWIRDIAWPWIRRTFGG